MKYLLIFCIALSYQASSFAFDLSGVKLKMLPLSSKDMSYSLMLKSYNYPQFKYYITEKCQRKFGEKFDSFITVGSSKMIVSTPKDKRHPLIKKLVRLFKKDAKKKVTVSFLKTDQIYCSYIE